MPIISCSTATTATPPRAATGRNGRRGCGSSWRACSRHCERSEAIHISTCCAMDCFVASLLAMTRRLNPRHHHVFDLDIFFHAVMRAFAPEAALLDAAERGDFGRDQAGVDADHARLQRLRDAPDAAEIARVEIGRQPERRV